MSDQVPEPVLGCLGGPGDNPPVDLLDISFAGGSGLEGVIGETRQTPAFPPQTNVGYVMVFGTGEISGLGPDGACGVGPTGPRLIPLFNAGGIPTGGSGLELPQVFEYTVGNNISSGRYSLKYRLESFTPDGTVTWTVLSRTEFDGACVPTVQTAGAFSETTHTEPISACIGD